MRVPPGCRCPVEELAADLDLNGEPRAVGSPPTCDDDARLCQCFELSKDASNGVARDARVLGYALYAGVNVDVAQTGVKPRQKNASGRPAGLDELFVECRRERGTVEIELPLIRRRLRLRHDPSLESGSFL